MNLSITDLLSRNEAPVGGLSVLAPNAGGRTIGASIAAFNELLDHYAARARTDAQTRDSGPAPASEHSSRNDRADAKRQAAAATHARKNNDEAKAPADSKSVAHADADAKPTPRKDTKATGADEASSDDASSGNKTDPDKADASFVPAAMAATHMERAQSAKPEKQASSQTAPAPSATSAPKSGTQIVEPQAPVSPAASPATATQKSGTANTNASKPAEAQVPPLPGDDGALVASVAATASAKGAAKASSAQHKGPPATHDRPQDHPSAPVLRAAAVTVEPGRISLDGRSPLAPGLLVAQEVAHGQGLAHAADTVGANTTANGQAGNGQAGKAAAGPTAAAHHVQPGTGTVPPQAGQSEIKLPAAAIAASGAGLTSAGTSTSVTAGGVGQVQGVPVLGPAQANMPGATGTSNQASASTRTPQPVPVPLDEVSVRIAKAAASGSDHISIKLKPESLGHVHVKLELAHDGHVTAVVTVDRAHTLDMLQRDAKGLERALQDAGLQTDSGSLQFNLRGDGQTASGQDGGAWQAPMQPAAPAPTYDEPTTATIIQPDYANRREASGGIDISV